MNFIDCCIRSPVFLCCYKLGKRSMLGVTKRKYVLVIGSIGLFIGFIGFVFIEAYNMKDIRTMQDEIYSTKPIDLTGLRDIRASGSNLPHFSTLEKRLSHVKENKIVVNAENELTGYIKGLPVTLFGYNNAKPFWRHYVRRLVFTGTLKERPDLVSSGAQEAEKYGFIYKNLVIGSSFTVPDHYIDNIVTFFDNYAQDYWIHFHCTHGMGRTSMLLAMLDIMKNAPEVKLKDILRRQYLLKSVNLADTVYWSGDKYTKEMLENRKKFIEDFYTFISQRKAGGIQRWSEWHQYNKEGREK